jgi:pimeloyl-ACP methyl ester carboxylesterase
MNTADANPTTIVLIHGFWVTPRSWEHWKAHYEAKGYTVLTPAYPGFEVEVEALRADPTPIEQLQVPEIIDMLENLIGKLDRPPIIMGHSAGGAFTQILLDHGFGAVGVAINSAPTEGVKVVPLSEIKSSFPILALYERYHILPPAGSSGGARSRTFTLGRTTPTSTTTTTLGRLCSSSPGSRILSSRRRSAIRTSGTTSRTP